MDQGARTQAQFRADGMYSNLYNAANKDRKNLSGLPGQARSQTQVRNEGLYRPIGVVLNKPKTLSGYFGDAAVKTAPGLLVAAGLVLAYFLFFGKKADATVAKADAAKETADEETADADAEEEAVSKYNFYY